MTQEIRHTQREYTSDEVLLKGEIAYLDSDTIKIGDGEKSFSQLPTFSSNSSAVDTYTTQVDGFNKIQAVGSKNKNTTDTYPVVFDWVGNVDEYTAQKAAGKIQPDWVCFITDDLSGSISSSVYTKNEIDAFLADKADGQGGAVMVTGDQYIEGKKTFLNSNIRSKSTSVDSTQIPAEDEYSQSIIAYDKNGSRIGCLESYHDTSGNIGYIINASVNINGNNVYSPWIGTFISKDGQTKWTSAQTPLSTTADDNQIATTAHIMNVLKAIYPVGSIYIGTQSTCPMASFFGTWSLVSSGRALWTGTGSNANTTIAAGLPNITGSFRYSTSSYSVSGAFYQTNSGGGQPWDGQGLGWHEATLDASRSSSIYGNSTTVQPPAYVVNVWRRTA